MEIGIAIFCLALGVIIGMYISSQVERSIDNNIAKNLDEFDRRERAEKRMDIIGQNGNDGLHYDKLEASDWDDGELDD
tara:strand:- start:887 stop:1120 length:234 start_codon:yes stop_codon:yes gene_type:complete